MSISRLLTSPSRFLQARSHSVVFGKRSWGGPWSTMGSAQPNQRMPRPSGSLIRCGISSNAVGVVT